MVPVDKVKKIIENFLIPISSRQQDLYRDLGMEQAAHILITLSYVQRILHRFQSALSDGYEEEGNSRQGSGERNHRCQVAET